MPRSTTAGRTRAWPTSSAIRKSIRTRSFRISASPIRCVTFTRDQIAWVYGSKWKQRYFTKVGDDFFPLGAQWDVTHKQWRAYRVANGTDWWTAFYPGGNEHAADRPAVRRLPLGELRHPHEEADRVERRLRDAVTARAAHTSPVRHARTSSTPRGSARWTASNVCVQCHSQGQPIAKPIDGKYYDWAVGYRPGLKLQDFWQLEEHKLGETTFTHFADGTAHKNRMQGNDFVQSLMYTRGVMCSTCHDVHGTANNADLRKPPQRDVPDVSWPAVGRTVRTRRRSNSTRTTRRTPPAVSASAAICRRSKRSSPT